MHRSPTSTPQTAAHQTPDQTPSAAHWLMMAHCAPRSRRSLNAICTFCQHSGVLGFCRDCALDSEDPVRASNQIFGMFLALIYRKEFANPSCSFSPSGGTRTREVFWEWSIAAPRVNYFLTLTAATQLIHKKPVLRRNGHLRRLVVRASERANSRMLVLQCVSRVVCLA